MSTPRVDEVDRQLTRLHAWRDRMTRDYYLQQNDKLLDLRNRVALVAYLEAEYGADLEIA